MAEDLRSAVDWDSLRTEVFCPVKHGGESVEHKADYYLRADCAHCDYLAVSPRCERTVSVLMRHTLRDVDGFVCALRKEDTRCTILLGGRRGEQMSDKNPTVALHVTERELAALVKAMGWQYAYPSLQEKLAAAGVDMRKAKTLKNRARKIARMEKKRG